VGVAAQEQRTCPDIFSETDIDIFSETVSGCDEDEAARMQRSIRHAA
jgi:hypothetical protein